MRLPATILNLRITQAQDTVLRAAADARGETASECVLRSAVEAAQTDLADRPSTVARGPPRRRLRLRTGRAERLVEASRSTLLLAGLGVGQEHQGRGVGAALLKHFVRKAVEVSASVGVRVLLVHAKDEEAKRFYEHYGFVASPVDPLTMMMLLPAGA